jgi:hypothetical protein
MWNNGPTYDNFEWNEDAKTTDDFNLIIDAEYKVKDFLKWFEFCFPKEFKAVQTLAKNEGTDIKEYIPRVMMFSDTDRAGIYIEYNNPLVKFSWYNGILKN